MEYTNSQIRDLIREHIHNERDRKILYRRLVDGVCFEPLAEEFDLSVSQTKRIIRKNTEILFRKMK
jgi:AraC-like DNA-binding protein